MTNRSDPWKWCETHLDPQRTWEWVEFGASNVMSGKCTLLNSILQGEPPILCKSDTCWEQADQALGFAKVYGWCEAHFGQESIGVWDSDFRSDDEFNEYQVAVRVWSKEHARLFKNRWCEC